METRVTRFTECLIFGLITDSVFVFSWNVSRCGT